MVVESTLKGKINLLLNLRQTSQTRNNLILLSTLQNYITLYSFFLRFNLNINTNAFKKTKSKIIAEISSLVDICNSVLIFSQETKKKSVV